VAFRRCTAIDFWDVMSYANRTTIHTLAALTASALCATAVAQSENVRELPTLAPLIERVAPAVVNITVSTSLEPGEQNPQEELLRRFFDFEGQPERRRQVEGAGSGVIVDAAKGYILTNHHVIEDADQITVTLLENRSLVARLIGSDQASDLAVLQVDPVNLKTIPFGDPGTLNVGDYVIAIGNPYGFSNTVTSGIVSGLGRSGLDSDAFEDFIQTDASINFGNSGGALINLQGELVGINSAIISRTGGSIGIGLAIPVSMALPIMEQLVATGTVRRGLLGVNIQDVTPEVAAISGLSNNLGALVSRVGVDSAAEKAGIQIWDVIVSINGTPLKGSGSLKSTIGLLQPGERVSVGLVRDGRPQTVIAVLGEIEPEERATRAELPPTEPELDPSFAGADLAANTDGTPGLLVARVTQNSPASLRGLQTGDVITRINKVPVRTVDEAISLMQDARAILLEVQRGRRNQIVTMR
jgi:Do/DeqQ family serine protease